MDVPGILTQSGKPAFVGLFGWCGAAGAYCIKRIDAPEFLPDLVSKLNVLFVAILLIFLPGDHSSLRIMDDPAPSPAPSFSFEISETA